MKTNPNRELLTKKIIKDIEKTGYPTELKAGKILEKHGWDVYYNVYYLDEDEKKGREIDLVAIEALFNHEPHVHIEYVLVGAVKKSSKPWVIFSTEVTGHEASGWDRILLTENIDVDILPSKYIDVDSTVIKFKNYGHAYHIAFQNNDSSILDALSSAVKAAEQSRKTYKGWYKEDEDDENKINSSDNNSTIFHNLTLIEPLIILDGQLYEAHLNYENRTIVKRINHIPICFGYISLEYRHAENFGNYVVEIITLDKLSSLLNNKTRWLDGLKSTIVQNILKVDKQ